MEYAGSGVRTPLVPHVRLAIHARRAITVHDTMIPTTPAVIISEAIGARTVTLACSIATSGDTPAGTDTHPDRGSLGHAMPAAINTTAHSMISRTGQRTSSSVSAAEGIWGSPLQALDAPLRDTCRMGTTVEVRLI